MPVDLSALGHEVARDLTAADPSRTVAIFVHADLRAEGDPILLRAVLTNLLGNAWKYTSRRPSARIELGQLGMEGDRRVFFVKDDGVGFDMKYAGKLFGVFQRLHTQDDFPGHGVGLATVERLVSRHGGRVWAEAKRDEGATFYFTLRAP